MHQFDYNLLKVLRALIETRNTRQAAEKLHLSQSAVSHALNRLRDTFNDPLFVRERYGLIPTERCQSIEKSLPVVFESIDALFEPGAKFNPMDYRGKITISLTNALTNTLGVKLFDTLVELAPNAEFEIMDWTWQVESALLSRKIDLALDYGPERYSKLIQQEKMPENYYTICVREGHPLTQLKRVGIDELAQYPFVLTRTPDWKSRHESAEQVMLSAGYEPHILLKSDSTQVSFNAIRHSDAIFPLPSSTYQLPEGITAIVPNEQLPAANMDLYAYYLHQTKNNALNFWLITEVRKLLSEQF